jgi:hypothetical protein
VSDATELSKIPVAPPLLPALPHGRRHHHRVQERGHPTERKKPMIPIHGSSDFRGRLVTRYAADPTDQNFVTWG